MHRQLRCPVRSRQSAVLSRGSHISPYTASCRQGEPGERCHREHRIAGRSAASEPTDPSQSIASSLSKCYCRRGTAYRREAPHPPPKVIAGMRPPAMSLPCRTSVEFSVDDPHMFVPVRRCQYLCAPPSRPAPHGGSSRCALVFLLARETRPTTGEDATPCHITPHAHTPNSSPTNSSLPPFVVQGLVLASHAYAIVMTCRRKVSAAPRRTR